MPNHNLENSNSIFAKHSFRVVYVSSVKIIVLINIKAFDEYFDGKRIISKERKKAATELFLDGGGICT